MDLQPYQTPPRWWSPMLNPAAFRFWRFIREKIRLQHHHLMEIEIRGLDHLRSCIDERQGILITPNHSSHADPTVMYWVADQLKIPFYCMATWQIFARSNWIRLLVLRQHGCFSVDRDGTDIRAFKQAVDILENKPYPLVIFPEGEIYHINKQVTPFRDGPSAMAMMAGKHADRPVSCIPCGIRYEYIQDPLPELIELMDRLEERILWRPRHHHILQQRIYHFAEAILGLKEQEFLGHTQNGPLPERIKSLAEFILSRLEDRYGISAGTSTLPERVKMCRRHTIQLIENEEISAEDHEAATEDLNDIFVVTQLFSYPGNVSTGTPTIEEMAETMDKFEEDVLQAPSASIRGTRRAFISFGKPISASAYNEGKSRTHELTELLENRVQSLVDDLYRTGG
jgi:1-acyl-sn-glycerol-3-phosphate acyltransferase